MKINQFCVCLISVAFLIAMFFLFTYMKSLAISNMFRYPATTNCDSVESIFSNQMDLYAEYADTDKDFTLNKQGTGIYQCYCKNRTSSYLELANSATDDNNLCHDYFVQFGGGYFLSEAITVVITVVNMIIAMIM